jgi:hypothetical protein
MRVEFKTDARNLRVRGALLGIGAAFEGIFRKHIGVARLHPRLGLVRDRRRRLAGREGSAREEDRAARRLMATMVDLDELALAMPQTTKELSDDGRPTYLVHGKFFCFHRSRRRDAIDPDTGERLDDVLVFRVADVGVKELMLADDRGVFFTTPHFDGYSAVLIRIPDLARIDRDELEDAVVEAWLTRAQKRVAKAWLDEHRLADD